jgi:hypothetical protein
MGAGATVVSSVVVVVVWGGGELHAARASIATTIAQVMGRGMAQSPVEVVVVVSDELDCANAAPVVMSSIVAVDRIKCFLAVLPFWREATSAQGCADVRHVAVSGRRRRRRSRRRARRQAAR